jgi:hypothetical protein
MGKWLKSLRGRKLVSEDTVREELRKVGLALLAGGALALVLQQNAYGLILMCVGALVSYFGLTKKPEE